MDTKWKTVLEDGSEVVRTFAWSPPGCHPVGCGLMLTVKDGELVKVEGDPEHPITHGALCPRCLALKDYVYHPDRILYPMKRAKEDRGKDKWERITWDEAIDTIVEKARYYSKTNGPESIVVFGGTGRASIDYGIPVAHLAFGSPNYCYAQSGTACYGPRAAVMGFIMGGGYPEVDYACRYPDRYDHPGWEPPKYVILWGKEPLKSNGDGFWGHAITDLMQRGTKLIMIDPRITWLGTRAEQVLQLRPGTDTALALAMLNVIITEDLYDHKFVDCWTYGFEELAERVKEYPPEWAEKITWIPKEQIIDVARKYATSKHSAIGWGLATDQLVNGLQLCQCILALMAITDNIDVPGGCTLGTPEEDKPHQILGGTIEEVRKYGIMSEELLARRIGTAEYPGMTEILTKAQPDCMLDTLESGEPYEIKMVFYQSSNIIAGAASAQPQRWYEALKDIDFAFGSEIFMTPTIMALADIVLPVGTFAEYDGRVATQYGMNAAFSAAINKAITIGECKSDLEITMAIGKRMFPEYWDQFDGVTDYLQKRWPAPKGMTWEEFRNAGAVQPREVFRKYEKGLLRADGKPGFNTRTGRIELYSLGYAGYGEDPLPYYEEPPVSPVSTPDLYEEYPLILTTGGRTFVSFHSEHRQIAALRAVVPDPLVEVHPDTAQALGLKDGDWVWIESPFGRCQQRVQVTKGVDPRVVHAMHGWWYPEEDPEGEDPYGTWRSNINEVMPHKYIGKMGYGNTFKNMLCRLYKVEDE